jgi:CHAD domain-containing protein
VTGDLRDLDVYLLDFPDLRASLPEKMRADLDPLLGVLEQRRARALTATRRALRAQRTGDALAEWSEFVTAQPPSEKTVLELASHRIKQVYGKMVKMGRAIDDDSPAEDLHELRKVGKELRYLLEFFASLFDADEVKPMVKTLKALQEVLGRFQDYEVQAHTLRDLGAQLAPEGEPAALMAMGALVAQLEVDQAAARAEFAEVFGPFAAKPRRKAVEAAFR